MNSSDSRNDCEVPQVILPEDITLTRPQVACDPAPLPILPVFVTPAPAALPRALPPRLPPPIIVESPRATAVCPGSTAQSSPEDPAYPITQGVAEFGANSVDVYWEGSGVVDDAPVDLSLAPSASRIFADAELFRLSATATNVSGVDALVDGTHTDSTYADLAQMLTTRYLIGCASVGSPDVLATKLSALVGFDIAQTRLFVRLLMAAVGASPSVVGITFADSLGGAVVPYGSDTTGLFSFSVLVAESNRACAYLGRSKYVCTPGGSNPFSTQDISPGDHQEPGYTQDEADAATLAWYTNHADMVGCLFVNAEVGDIYCPSGTLVGEVTTLGDVASGASTTTKLVTRVHITAGVYGYIDGTDLVPDTSKTNDGSKFRAVMTTYVGSTATSEIIDAFVSGISVSDATASALAFAQEQLTCFCGSGGATAYCAGTDATTYGYASTVGTIPSGDSTELISRASGDSDLLSGLYTVEPVALVGSSFVLQAGTGMIAHVNAHTGLHLFLVPVGAVASSGDVSAAQSSADLEMRSWLSSWLVCKWYSPENTCKCVPGTPTDDPGGTLPARWPDQTSSWLSSHKVSLNLEKSSRVNWPDPDSTTTANRYTLRAGQFAEENRPVLTGSVAAAWAASLSPWCTAGIVCVFCNTQIDATCNTAFSGSSMTGATIDTLPAVVPADTHVSSDISQGLLASTVCGADPTALQAQAAVLAALPPVNTGALAGSTCLFTNNTLTTGCVQKAQLEGSSALTGLTGSSVSLVAPTGDTLTLTPSEALYVAALHADSYDVTVTVPAGVFGVNQDGSITADDAYAAAQRMAADFANSIMRCEYTNSNIKLFCGASTTPSALPPKNTYGDAPEAYLGASGGAHPSDVFVTRLEGWEFVRPAELVTSTYWQPYGSGAGVDGSSTGSTDRPIIIPTGKYRSADSPLSAQQLAFDGEQGGLNCYYSAGATVTCATESDSRPDSRDFIFQSQPHSVEDAKYVVYKDGKPLRLWSNWLFAADALGLPYEQSFNLLQTTIYPPSSFATAISYVSHADAVEQATAKAKANLQCSYSNWGRSLWCSKGSSASVTYDTYTVPAGMFLAQSTTDADIQAETLASANVKCQPCATNQLVATTQGAKIKVFMCSSGSVSFGSGKLGKCKPKSRGNYDAESILYDGVNHQEDCPTQKITPRQALASFSPGSWVDFWVETRCCGGFARHILRASASHGTAPYNAGYTPTRPSNMKTDDTADRPDSIFTHLGTAGADAPTTDKPRPVPVVVQAAPGTVSVDRGGVDMPWLGQLTATPGTTTTYKIKISNARLHNTVLASGLTAVLNADKDITITNGAKLWLVVTVDSLLALTEATITTTAPTSTINFDTSTPPLQTTAGVIIGELVDGDWKQYLTTNLCMFAVVVDGKAASYPMAFAG